MIIHTFHLRPSLHFTPLHSTSIHFTSHHFTSLHNTILHFPFFTSLHFGTFRHHASKPPSFLLTYTFFPHPLYVIYKAKVPSASTGNLFHLLFCLIRVRACARARARVCVCDREREREREGRTP